MGIISGGWYKDEENPRESVKRRTNACLFAVTISKSNPPKQGFLFQILWCSQTDYHSQEELAIFGYRPDVKVKSAKNWLVFWLPAVEIWWFLFLFGNLANQGHFFKKNLVMCRNHIFEVGNMWKFAGKKDSLELVNTMK